MYIIIRCYHLNPPHEIFYLHIKRYSNSRMKTAGIIEMEGVDAMNFNIMKVISIVRFHKY